MRTRQNLSRRGRHVALLAAAAWITSCGLLARTETECSERRPCPAGQSCDPDRSICVADTRDGGADQSVVVEPDMAVLDFRDPLVDLSEADLTPTPCTGSGVAITSSVSACKGNFTSAAQQRAVCGLGHHLCEARDLTALIAAGSTGLCDTVGGLFVARIAASSLGTSFSCPPKSGETTTLIGCGSGEAGIVSFTNANCYGLNAAFVCKAVSGSEWRCTDTGLDGATHANGSNKGGLLCCRD